MVVQNPGGKGRSKRYNVKFERSTVPMSEGNRLRKNVNVERTEKERILRKTTTHEVIERSFTTEPKRKSIINISRKGSIVKERCSQLTEIALELFPDRIITNRDLVDLVKRYIGGFRDTVRDYVGYQGRITSNSFANLKIQGSPRRGYLEIFGFMHRQGMKWIIHAQTKLKGSNPPVPPFSKINECVRVKKPIENISLSPLSIISSSNVERGNGGKPGTVTSGCPPTNREVVRKKEEEDTVRERNLFHRSLEKKQKHDKILTCSEDPNLAYLEFLAKAKPGEEPDRGHVDWGPQKPIIPKKEGASDG